MKAIDTNEHLKQLRGLALKYEFPLEELLVVESIQEWCKERKIEENNPFRTGKCLRNRETGKYLILLAAEITPDMCNSVISVMKLRGYGEEVEVLYSAFPFLAHLLLHEVAHAKNENWSERECDSWAFEELNKIAI